jgi:ABC-type uncharacterized transport system involved in gliding motility auxiliary subunit
MKLQNMDLKQFAPWAAIVGVLGLLAAGVLWLLYRQLNAAVQVSLIVGLLALVAAILFRPGAVTEWAQGRQARYGANTALMVVALVGILVLLNYIVARLPVETRQRDLSEGSVNTLPQEAIEAMKAAPGPVRAIGFYTSRLASSQGSTRETLEKFRAVDPDKLSYEFVDPETNPVRAREYNVTRDGTLFLESGAQREEIRIVSDAEIASALVRFAQPDQRVIYVTTGRGEKGLEAGQQQEASMSVVVDLLKKQNYEVRPLSLQLTTTVPSDARAVIVPGPVQPLSAEEVARLSEYLNRPNAALVALLDPTAQTQGAETGGPDPLADYLSATWGVTARNDVVIDFARSIQGQPLWIVANRYGTSPITDRLQNFATFFPIARSLEFTTTLPGLTSSMLVESSDQAWGETDIASLNSSSGPAFDSADATGPLALGVSVENTGTNARVVVFGDSEFASDAFANEFANSNLFVNSVNWATQDDTLINLTQRTPPQRSLRAIDALTGNLILFVTVIALPALVLVAGGLVWFQRRRHT